LGGGEIPPGAMAPSGIVDEFVLVDTVRIQLTKCGNATQLGRVYDILRVSPIRMFGRDIRNRNMSEISLVRAEFVRVDIDSGNLNR
jgi:hypothetical protein